MSGLLSLKWNNHASVFLNLLQTLRIKELYCDTTIVCQGKFYPVHKLVLSTCSEYFEDILRRIECKHPFILMKDVDPPHLEALLNYMYKGEVNVFQESLPGLIKTAEALKIKGLAVPDDVSTEENFSHLGEKRMNVTTTNSSHDDNPNKVRRVKSSSEERAFSCNSEDINKVVTESNLTHSQPLPKDGTQDNLSSRSLNTMEFKTESEPDPLWNENVEVFVKAEQLEQEGTPDVIPKDDSSFNFASLLPNHSEVSNTVDKNGDPKDFRDPRHSPPISSHLASALASTESQECFTQPNNASIPWIEDGPSTSSEQELIQNLVTPEVPSALAHAMSQHLLKHTRKLPRRGISKAFFNTVASSLSSFKHTCSFCSYGSYSSSAVRKHEMRIHTGIRPYACSRCHYSSTTKDGLRIHFRSHTGEKPYQCQHCSYKSSCYANMKKHTRSVHKIA